MAEWQKRDTRQYVRYGDAERMGKKLNITGFADAMVSRAARHLQDKGFAYDRVLRGGDEENSVGDGEVAVSIGNKYGDALVFVKK